MWTRAEDQIELIMIRHGKTRSNEEHRYLGRTDESLSKNGIEEIKKKRKGYPPCSLVYVSPMKRCLETADLIHPHVELHKIEEWREMDFGRFERKNYEELKDDPYYQKWIDSHASLPFPEGESREEFNHRSILGFQKMMKELEEKKEKKAMMVVHGGTIMAVCAYLTGKEYFDFQVKNAEGYVCRLCKKKNDWKVMELKKI